jgi:pimeloyl-ACP methyl ester carboxylesterase
MITRTRSKPGRPNPAARSGVAPRPQTVTSADGTTIGYQTLGSGEAVILIGGTLQAAHDYLPLARLLAPTLTVHVMDRRGRGASGPQGPGYSIESELEDLLAVQGETGATSVFGHSYGGLISLEAARKSDTFRRVAAYEPGVSVGGSMPVSWLNDYHRALLAGDSRGAFAIMARGAGHAPPSLARMPLGLVRGLMYCLPRSQWRELEPLLPTALAENNQIASLDAPSASRFAAVTARVLLLGGTKSPAAITSEGLEALREAIPSSELEMLDGLRHTAPARKAAFPVADALLRFLHPAHASEAPAEELHRRTR